MPPVRTVCAPWCGSSSEDEPQPDQADVSSRRQTHKSGNQRGNIISDKTRSVLKAKVPKLRKTLRKDDRTPGRWVLESAAAVAKDPVARGAAALGAGVDSGLVGGDAFSFSQRPASKAPSEKDQAKLAVLRTISKVLEENQLTRRRLSALSRASSKLH